METPGPFLFSATPVFITRRSGYTHHQRIAIIISQQISITVTDPSVFLQVINLDRSPDRLNWMTTALGQQGIVFTRLAAVDGKDRRPEDLGDYDPARSRKLFGRELLNGEVGCFQSHLNAAQAFLDGPDDIGLVLEDDVNVPDGFATMIECLQRLAGQIDANDTHHDDRRQHKPLWRAGNHSPDRDADPPDCKMYEIGHQHRCK